MAKVLFDGLDENKIWLHAERVDNKLTIVDQDGRVVGGITGASVYFTTDIVTNLGLTVHSASRKEGGKISLDIKG